MEPEPIFERTIELPLGYVFTARARPSTVRRTLIHLVPWAIYMALPKGRLSTVGRAVAMRVSPMMKQKVK